VISGLAPSSPPSPAASESGRQARDSWSRQIVWESHPGAFLYLVVNQIVQTGDSSARWIETEAIGKLGITFRF
jgi:hypothetical protein